MTEADYITNNYGSCAKEPCACLKNDWLGRACPHWRPVSWRSWDEALKFWRKVLDSNQ